MTRRVSDQRQQWQRACGNISGHGDMTAEKRKGNVAAKKKKSAKKAAMAKAKQ